MNNIDKAFEKWVNKEHKRTKKGGSAITKKEIRSIYNEPFTAGYKQAQEDIGIKHLPTSDMVAPDAD